MHLKIYTLIKKMLSKYSFIKLYKLWILIHIEQVQLPEFEVVKENWNNCIIIIKKNLSKSRLKLELILEYFDQKYEIWKIDKLFLSKLYNSNTKDIIGSNRWDRLMIHTERLNSLYTQYEIGRKYWSNFKVIARILWLYLKIHLRCAYMHVYVS